MFAMLAALIEAVGAGGLTLIIAFTFASMGVGAMSSAVVAAAIARITEASLAGAVFVSLLVSAYPAAAFYGFAVLATCCAIGRGFWSADECGCR